MREPRTFDIVQPHRCTPYYENERLLSVKEATLDFCPRAILLLTNARDRRCRDTPSRRDRSENNSRVGILVLRS